MRNRVLSGGIAALAIAIMCSGCASVHARLEDRIRVDQDIPGQSPTPVKTRKVVVIEVNEKAKDSDAVQKIKEEEMRGREMVLPAGGDTVSRHAGRSEEVIPTGKVLSDKPAAVASSSYRVEKDDTLQKIAKKFYGVYGQWTVIYEANRDVLKNPNFVKPGIVLKIPPAAEEKK